MRQINRINFDTRTVNDLIYLNDDLKFEIISILEEEEFISKKDRKKSLMNENKFLSDGFVTVVLPSMKDCLKSFMKKNLNKIGLSVLKGMVDLNNVDYKYIITVLVKV